MIDEQTIEQLLNYIKRRQKYAEDREKHGDYASPRHCSAYFSGYLEALDNLEIKLTEILKEAPSSI